MAQTSVRSHSGSHIAHPHTLRDDATQLTSLLKEFLDNVNDPVMHMRFWADDLIYVSSAGTVRTKAAIVNAVRVEAVQAASGKALPPEKYSAEEITVRSYGPLAVINFTLVAHEPEAATEKLRRYRNSGVFQLNADGWQAISWQSTAIPETAKR